MNQPNPTAASEIAGQFSYIDRRLEPQRQWHDKAAGRAKAVHYRLSTIQLTAMALVPVVNTAPNHGGWLSAALITSALAASAAVVTGLLALGRYQETWTRSRRTAAALEVLRIRYETGADPFDGEDREAALVHECEAILSGEMEQWITTVKANQPGKAAHGHNGGKASPKAKRG